jgi:phage gp45-like
MIKTIIRRVVLSAIRDGQIRRFDASGVAGEQFLDREFFQQYGLTSRPKPNAEGIVIGQGNVFYLIASDDRTCRLTLQNDGDVALNTGPDSYVLIKASGDIEIKSASKVTVTAPVVELADGAQRKLMDERLVDAFNNHVHATAATGPPSMPTTPLVLADVATTKTKGS